VKLNRPAGPTRNGVFGTWESECRLSTSQESQMSLGTILLIILILLVIGAIPSWPYSSGWGYYPVGGLGTILIIVLILVLLGRL
jgi:hypothetical protein